jgi:hypothetical protein
MAALLVPTGLEVRVLLPECGHDPVDEPNGSADPVPLIGSQPWEPEPAGCIELADELDDNPDPKALGIRVLSASKEVKIFIRRASMATAPSFVMKEG